MGNKGKIITTFVKLKNISVFSPKIVFYKNDNISFNTVALSSYFVWKLFLMFMSLSFFLPNLD
jgi:hypothetical protein